VKKPCLYILCGFPFAGKTTLARALIGALGIKRVAIDDINAERGVWDDERGLSAEEWTKTYNEAYRRIDAFLSQGESVIDDSVNFTRELRDRLHAIAQRRDACTIVIYVDVSLSEAQRRWQENRQTAVRADVRDDDFAHVLEHFEPPTEDEQMLRYDGILPVEEWIGLTFFHQTPDANHEIPSHTAVYSATINDSNATLLRVERNTTDNI
jgi:predicted kinase